MSARSVFCSSCDKTYYPCPETKTDSECCKNACKKTPTLTNNKPKPVDPKMGRGGSVCRFGCAVGPNGVL